MAFPGFNNSKKRGTISNGDFDRDGVKNRKDCEPLNFRKQDGGKIFSEGYTDDAVSEHNRKLMQGYAPGEKELIEARLEEIRLKKKLEKGGNY